MGMQPLDFPRLAPELETTLFRVIQEALTNVFRHSRQPRHSLRWKKERARIAVTVRDDGVGVPDEITEFRDGSIGVGIGGMRQRIKEHGGEFGPAERASGHNRGGRHSNEFCLNGPSGCPAAIPSQKTHGEG